MNLKQLNDSADRGLEKEILLRITEIDQSFEAATGWGSWMVPCSIEREQLVERLAKLGVSIPHRFLARDGDGRRVS